MKYVCKVLSAVWAGDSQRCLLVQATGHLPSHHPGVVDMWVDLGKILLELLNPRVSELVIDNVIMTAAYLL